MNNLALDFSGKSFCKGCNDYHDRDGWYYRKNGTKQCRVRRAASSSASQKRRLDTVREYQREYRLSRKDDPRWKALRDARLARHKAKHPRSSAEKQRRWRLRHPEFQIWRGARGRAKENGIEFALTREWVAERVARGRCELTDLPFQPNETNGRCGPFAPSIDRRDSSKGYTTENCRVVIWAINMGMSEWGENVYAHVAAAFLEKKRGG